MLISVRIVALDGFDGSMAHINTSDWTVPLTVVVVMTTCSLADGTATTLD